MIVGTAGHIDHGKTALVRALTGVETDRLREERARGITIDLGFAYLPCDGPRGGGTIGFVDVPGHERFVHTMLVGANGIDFAVLAVAADDGIMPQTLEHLAILDLLGIRRGLVAITKADLADAPRRAAVEAELAAALAPTALAGAPILPVSALTGEGLPELRAALERAAAATPAPAGAGGFRLAVDRCFTMVGAGTVVTGTVLSGAVAVGDAVTVSPSGLSARVRAVHVANRPAARGLAGQRCALNLVGEDVTKDAVGRGDTVLDPALHAPADRVDALLRVLPGERKAIGDWFPVRLHHAGAEVGARIVPLEGAVAPGEAARAQLVLDRPIAAAVGDRYVLRDVSAQRTLGGGRFLDLRAPARKRRSPERLALLDAMARFDPADALARLLDLPPFLVELNGFGRDRALSAAETDALAASPGLVVLAAGGHRQAVSRSRWAGFRAALADALARHHEENPDQQGMGRERLRTALRPRLPAPAFVTALEQEAAAGAVVLDGAFVRLPGHEVQLAPADEAVFARIAPLLGGEARFRPPRVRDLVPLVDAAEPEVRRVLRLCARLGRVDQVAHDHFFLRSTTAEMVCIARDVAARAADGQIVAAAFRDRMDNGRKVAIQILDFLDRHGVTLRRGDLRRINPHRTDLFRTVGGADAGVAGTGDADGGESFPVGRPDFKSGWGSETVPGGFDSHSLPPSDDPAAFPSATGRTA